jgi:hypothetical protein
MRVVQFVPETRLFDVLLSQGGAPGDFQCLRADCEYDRTMEKDPKEDECQLTQ